MKTKHELELADVKAIAAAAEAEAIRNQWAVTIAIVDEIFNVTLDGSALGKCEKVSDIEALIEKAKA